MRFLFSPKFGSTLLVTGLAALTVGCDKNTNKSSKTTVSTSSTTTTVVSSATSATAVTDAPLSVTSAPAPTSAVSATSAPATTQVQGNPKETVEKVVAALRTGNVKTAMTYIQTNDPKAISQFLTQNIPQYKNIKSVKYDEPLFSPEKDRAQVIARFSTKNAPRPIETPYGLVLTPAGWKLLAEAPPKNTPPVGKDGKPQGELLTASEAAALKANQGKNATPIMTKDKNGKVIATLPTQAQSAATRKPRTEPIIVDTTKKGTPEDTVKQAMNTLITGTPKEAVKFYKSKNPKLTEIVANQQVAFQQNLQSMKIVETKYSKNKTHAEVNVLVTQFPPEPAPTKANKHSKKKAKPLPAPKPQPAIIQLEKKAGVWKILAD